MEQLSTGLCNSLLATGSLKAAFTNMVIRIFAGAVPATADADATGNTVICDVKTAVGSNTPYLTFGTASGGAIAINSTETWVGTNTGALGTAAFYRVVGFSDGNGSSTSSARIQGTIGVTGSADMIVGSVSVAGSGGTFPVTLFTQSIVPS